MCRVLPSSYAFHNYLCYQHCDVCGRQNVQPQSRTAKHSQRVSCPSSDSQSYPNGCQLRHIPWILWMYGANNALVDVFNVKSLQERVDKNVLRISQDCIGWREFQEALTSLLIRWCVETMCRLPLVPLTATALIYQFHWVGRLPLELFVWVGLVLLWMQSSDDSPYWHNKNLMLAQPHMLHAVQ